MPPFLIMGMGVFLLGGAPRENDADQDMQEQRPAGWHERNKCAFC